MGRCSSAETNLRHASQIQLHNDDYHDDTNDDNDDDSDDDNVCAREGESEMMIMAD